MIKYRKRRKGKLGSFRYYVRRIILIIIGKINSVIPIGVFSIDWLSTYWKRKRFVYADGDYIRNSSLELVAREIDKNNVNGAVAELGVFRGDYAKLINCAFPDKKLYLFDTFTGFDARDINFEKRKGFNDEVDDFSNTTVRHVLKKMMYPDNCVIVKGYFPETVNDLEECFAFVSIDCDLYTPVLNGLNYFWKHLVEGGYIFVHDYQDPVYSGVRAAVIEFCFINNVAYFPMTDICGSIIIAKPLKGA